MKVLLGIDGTGGSADAIDRTVGRAVEAGDDLTVAIVAAEASDASPDDLAERVESAVSETDLAVDIRRETGTPGSVLVEIAETEGFDEIVIAGGTTSPMGKINLNNTAEFVLLNSHVTVTLVR